MLKTGAQQSALSGGGVTMCFSQPSEPLHGVRAGPGAAIAGDGAGRCVLGLLGVVLRGVVVES